MRDKNWSRLPQKPEWAEKLGPPPAHCLFCGDRVAGHFLAGVYSPKRNLEAKVKDYFAFMLSVCEDCLESINEEDIGQRIEKEIVRLTRVN